MNAVRSTRAVQARWLHTPLLALLVVLALFWAMRRAIIPPEREAQMAEDSTDVTIVQPQPETLSPEELLTAESAPPPPPAAPPSLPRPEMPSINAPSMAGAPLDAGPITVPTTLGNAGMNLGSSGVFGGFAGRAGGSGTGSGAGGVGSGQGFKGRPLVPLSTARPQMPDWACKQGIRGWVEVVFTVMPNGRVRDVKLVDADPRGVFEAAAVESISNWIYAETKRAREVKQRVDMNPEDCAFNWR
jgi:protein TonB